MTMISGRFGAHRFHLRAAAIVVRYGHLLLHRLEGDVFWALPGGRIHAGETATQALTREFHEELGLAVTCEALVCTGENFFAYNGEPHHEVGLYFSVGLPTGCTLLALDRTHRGVEGDRALDFRWFPLDQLRSTDARPRALIDALAAGPCPTHFVQPAV